jgi:hypothetical protein
VRDANYIPFGVTGNRPCPAQNLALITMKAAACQLLRRFSFLTSASHTRSMPNRGPCLLLPARRQLRMPARQAGLLFLRARDRIEDVIRSVVQLVLGTYMVWHARRLRLCERYFAGREPSRPDSAGGSHADVCPVR